MSSYNWNNFDGSQFQKLCNALLLFEVSKFAHVFSAEGKDAGVDQYYIGTYGGKSGKWRFQDKFHSSGNNANDVAALKRDITTDIKSNYQDENFIVIISNLNLGKKKYDELIKAGQDALLAKGAKDCEFVLWHEATLEVFLGLYPIVYHWFWERESVLLQTFESYFSRQLSISSYDLRYQLINPFYGRKKEITALLGFVNDPKKSTLAIVANGGYGKTRLVIEFFKDEITKNDEWLPLVISHMGFNPNQFAHLLNTKKKLLLLIDNAHEVPEIVSEAKRLIENTHGKDKLVLTTRPTLFSDILQKIPSHGRNIEKINLEKLPYDEAKKMIQAEIPNLKNNQVIYLAQVSKGVPNVILELIRLVRLGKQPQQISAEEAFWESVQEIFLEAIKEIESKTGIAKEKIMDFLRLISLISPVSNIEKDILFIAELLDIRSDKVELLINEFANLGLLENGTNISIKPDPYSDSILVETIRKNKAFVERVRNSNGAENYLENILKNLSEAEIEDDQKKQFIEDLVNGYVRILEDKTTEVKKIKSIFEFVEKIVPYKPWTAPFTIRQFLTIYNDTTHPIKSAFAPWSTQSYIKQLEDITIKIFYALFAYTQYAKNNKEEVQTIIEDFIRETGNLNVLRTCYMYHEWDFDYYGYHPRQCSENQLFLKSIICEYFKDFDNAFKVNIALFSAEFLLELEFPLEEYYEAETMAFHYGHAQVPYCQHIKEIRTDILLAVIDFYKISNDTKLKERVLKLLNGYFFYSCINSSQKHTQDLSEELNIALKFFEDLLNDNPSTDEKTKIISSILRYQVAGFKVEVKERIEQLKIKAEQTHSLSEKLELNLLNDNYFDVKNNFEKRLLELIKQYNSFDDFQKDLLKIRVQINNKPSQFKIALSIIGKFYSQEAKALLEEIKNHYPDLIPEGELLIKCFYTEIEYFDSILNWLWDKKEKYIESFFWLLNYGRNKNKDFYKVSELEYYEYIIENKKEGLYHYITYVLIDYAYVEKHKTFELLNLFMKIADHNNIEYLMLSLLDEKDSYKKDFREDIKKLFNENLDKISLADGHSNQLLQFFDDYFGFDELFNFINKKIEQDIDFDEDAYFNFGRVFYRNDHLTEEQVNQRYIQILAWYTDNYELDSEKSDRIVNIFKPGVVITPNLKEHLINFVQSTSLGKDKLKLVAKCLKSFQNNSDEWINVMSLIADHCVQIDSKINFTDIYGSSFYENYGSKSKVGLHVPYREDLYKKEILTKIISEKRYSGKIIEYLQTCLRNVEDDILEELQKDKEKSNW